MDKQFSVVDLLSSFLPDFVKKQYFEADDDADRYQIDGQTHEETSPEIVCFPALALSLRITNAEHVIEEPLMDQWNDHYATMSSFGNDSKGHDIPLMLTDVIEQIAPLITRLGGDLMWFKGDYLLAIFKLEDEETASVLLRAIICGMHLKEMLHDKELTHSPRKKLQILVSIAGADKEQSKENATVYCGFLGGFQQRPQLAVGGLPVARAAELSYYSFAHRNGRVVIIAKELWDLVRSKCEGTAFLDLGYVAVHQVNQNLTSPQNVIENRRPNFKDREAITKLVKSLWKHIPQPAQLVIGDPLKRELQSTDSLFWMNEFRVVTVLCFNFPYLEYNWTGGNMIHHFVITVQRIVQHYQGIITNIMVLNRKGTMIEVAFGIPMLAREKLAVTGILSSFVFMQQHHLMVQQLKQKHQQALRHRDKDGLEVLDASSEKAPDLTCRIGISTGIAVCAIIGGNIRRDYVVCGKVRDVARGLANMSLENDSTCVVRCDAATRSASLGSFKFRQISPDIYEPFARTDPPFKPLESVGSDMLIGRALELSILKERLDKLMRRRQGGLVLLESDAGMGKSRLVREFSWLCHTESQICLDSSADMHDQVTSYFIWQRIFNQLFRYNLLNRADTESDYHSSSTSSSSSDGSDADYIKRRSSSTTSISSGEKRVVTNIVESTIRQMGSFPPALYCWTPLLQVVIPELKGISLPDMVDLQRVKKEVSSEKTLELLVYLLREASKESPLVIILDDFQWMDTYSWRLLSIAVKALTSILFVITGRGFPSADQAPPEYQKLCKMITDSGPGRPSTPNVATKIELHALPVEDSKEVVAQVMRSEEYEDSYDDSYDSTEDKEAGIKEKPSDHIDFYNHSEKQLLQKSARASIVEKVCEQAQGNPFFIEQLTRSIITKRKELRALQKQRQEELSQQPNNRRRSGSANKWRTRSNSANNSTVFNGTTPTDNTGPHLPMMTYFLPDSIVDLIASKFDALSWEQRLLLKVASVIGTFELRILEGVFPPIQRQRMNLRLQLEKLEKLGFIQCEVCPSPSSRIGSSQAIYSFTQLLAQEAIYKMMHNQKMQFHQWVADWYDKSIDNLAPYYSLLATHYTRANNLKKTLHFSMLAGEKAYDDFRYDEAVYFFHAASRIANILSQRAAVQPIGTDLHHSVVDSVTLASIERKLSESLMYLGNYKEVLKHLEYALVLLKQPFPSSNSGNLTNLLGEVVVQGWHRYKSSPTTNYTASRDVLEAVKTYLRLGELFTIKAEEPTKAIFSIVRAINLIEGVSNPPPELAVCYGFMVMLTGVATTFSSLPMMYDGLLQKALSQQGYSEHPPTLLCNAKALYTAAVYHTTTASFHKAEQYFQNAIRIYHENVHRTEAARAKCFYAYHLLQQSRITDCLQAFQKVIQSAQLQDVEAQILAQIGICCVYTLQNKTAEVLQVLEEVEPRAPAMLKPIAYGLLAKAHLRCNKIALAVEVVNGTIDTVLPNKPYFMMLDGQFLILEVLLLVWEVDTLSKFITPELRNKAKALLTRIETNLYRVSVGKPRALVFRGLYEWIVGNVSKAEKKWIEACNVAKELGLRSDYALALHELERHYCFCTKTFRKNGETSHSIFQSLGIAAPYRPDKLDML